MTFVPKLLIFPSAVLFTVATTQAKTITLETVDGVSSGIGPGNNTILSINNNSSTITGIFGLVIDGQPVDGFCVEPDQVIYLNTPFIYEPFSVYDVYSSQKANDLELLLGKYGTLPMTPLNTAALQISLWEIASADSVYNLGDGSFRIHGNDVIQPGGFTDTQAIDLAYDWLSHLDGINRAEITIYRNKEFQDIITWNNVPDGGSTLSLCGLSLLGLAGARKLANARRR